MIRSLYVWTLGLAEKPYSHWTLFLISFIEASFFPLPPDILLMALCTGKPKKSFFFVMYALVGSVLGGVLGYYLGWGFWSLLSEMFFVYVPGVKEVTFNKVAQLYQTHAGWAVFAAGLTPLPYKVFSIAAGVMKVSIVTFVLASIVSRGLRFLILGGLIYFFGSSIRSFIDKYFNTLTVLFFVLLAAGFFLLKCL